MVELPKIEVNHGVILACIDKQIDSHKPDGRTLTWVKGEPLRELNNSWLSGFSEEEYS
jgi:hypothetical protein